MRDENMWRSWVSQSFWSQATGFEFQKSNRKPDPKAPKVEPTLDTWEEFERKHILPDLSDEEPKEENTMVDYIKFLAKGAV